MKTFTVGPGGYIHLWTQSSVHVHIHDSPKLIYSLVLALRPKAKLECGARVPKKLHLEAWNIFFEIMRSLRQTMNLEKPFSILISGHGYGGALAAMLVLIVRDQLPKAVIRLHCIGAPMFLSEQSAGIIAESAACVSYSYGFDILPWFRLPGTFGIGEPVHLNTWFRFRAKLFLEHHEAANYRSMVPPYEI